MLGVDVELAAVSTGAASFGDIAALFGESASRAIVSTTAGGAATLLALARAAGVPAVQIGTVGGDRLRIGVDGRAVIDEPLGEAERIWSSALDQYFGPARAIA
jgi:phosphoribosylformylglycinamidine synthase